MSNNNGQGQQPQAGPPNYGPIIHQLTVNLHDGGKISFNYPKDFKIFSVMIGNLLLHMPGLQFEKPSSIIQLPPGAKLKEPGQ